METDQEADMVEVTMCGGYSYTIGDPETFPSYRAACEAWYDRWSSNGIRKVDGVLWPTWGDMADDGYAIVTEYDGLTREQVIAIAEGADMPYGWEDRDDEDTN